jgi:hypothetical protein
MLTKRVWGGLLAAALVTAGGCSNCGVEDFTDMVPVMDLSACQRDGVSECRVTFFALVGASQTQTILVKNTGESDLNLSAVAVGEGGAPAFALEGEVPRVVKPQDTAGKPIKVRFAPVAEGAATSQLRITSDASNVTAEDKTVVIQLEATSRMPAAGHFTISPTSCDFGDVGVGSTTFCDLTLGNDGENEVTVTAFDMAEANDPAFSPASVLVAPMYIPPGSTVPLRVAFAPTEDRVHTGGLYFDTSDATQPRVDVLLTGRAFLGPAVVARILTVNGQPHDGTTPIRPLDSVVLTGTQTTAATGRTLAGFQWELLSKPAGSTTVPATPGQATTSLQSQDGATTREALDLAGTYVARLTVTDDIGTTGSAEVTIPAVMGHFTVSPPACDFGSVPVNSTTYCTLTLGNDGQGDVTVTGFGTAANNDPAFGPADPFTPPVVLPTAGTVTLRVSFLPTAPGSFQGGLYFETSDPTQPRVDVALQGRASDGPTAVARISTVNGMPYMTGQMLRPLDNVVLTGQDSQATVGRTLTGYRWDVTTRPAGSMLEMATPTQPTSGFRFSNSGSFHNGVDLVGTYTTRLTVTDDLGQTGTAEVTFTTVAAEDLHVQLTWDSAQADLDLHLTRGSGAPFSATDDCYFQNCGSVLYTVNWGGGNANPHLDVDDLCGYGPENINIQNPSAGTYTVGVDFYGMNDSACSGFYATPSGQAVTPSVRIFIHGELRGEYSRTINCARTGSYWKVAQVTWGASPTVQDINQITAVTQSSCGR